MNLYIRLLRVLIQSFLRKKLGTFQTSVVHFFVMPTDLDLNFHMTNSRYLSLMDIGRIDLLMRTGLYKTVRAQRLGPVLGSSVVRWRRGLNLGQVFSLHTRLLGWDEKWFYIEQRFKRQGKTVCYAYVRATFVGKNGVASAEKVSKDYQKDLVSPPLPLAIKLWNDMEQEQRITFQDETGEERP